LKLQKQVNFRVALLLSYRYFGSQVKYVSVSVKIWAQY